MPLLELKDPLQEPSLTRGPATLPPHPIQPEGTVGADKQGKSTISLKEQLGRYKASTVSDPTMAQSPLRPQLQLLINR